MTESVSRMIKNEAFHKKCNVVISNSSGYSIKTPHPHEALFDPEFIIKE